MQLCLSLIVYVILKEGYAGVNRGKNLQLYQSREAEVMSFACIKQLQLYFHGVSQQLKKKRVQANVKSTESDMFH